MAGGEEAAPNSGCCNGRRIIQMILFGIWTPIGIALIVVGAKYLNQCPDERFIPIYMIVAGAFSFAYWVLLPLECCLPTIRRILSILVALFVFAWFIAGSVWVFRIYGNSPRDCHNGMYLFAFSILIIQYIFIGLGLIGSLLACCCCENSCVTKICGYFQTCLECCPCLECLRCLKCSCLESCPCLKCCSCLQSCTCLESCCSCLQSCSCLECLQCSDCCQCFKSLCCCCKSFQCNSCLNCSMCAQCCKCLQCCSAKV